MYIKPSKRKNGKTYLQIVEPYRENGKNRSKSIRSLGYKEDLEKDHPDIENYLKEVLEQTKEEYGETIKDRIQITIKRDDSKPIKNLGYAIAKKIYSKLEIKRFLDNRSRHMDLRYNLNQVFLLLVMNRFVEPGSKRKAYRTRNVFFERFDFSEQQMYQSLKVIAKLSEPLQAHLYEQTQKLVELDKSNCKYDVTNFYYFSEEEDENITDKEGNVIKKGLKRKGPSKEGVNLPIVQLGLLCDKTGIPMTFDIFSGATSEKTRFLPLINSSQEKLHLPRITVIADRGINTATNMYGLAGDNGAYKSDRRSQDSNVFITEKRNGFIFGQTIRNQSAERIEWILDPSNYEIIKVDGITCKFKSRIVNRKIKVNTIDGKRTQRLIRVKELVYYNSVYDVRCKHQRYKILEKACKMIESASDYNRGLQSGGRKYIKNINYKNVDGEKVVADKQERTFDIEKIKEDEKLDGYYCLTTSELEMPDHEVWENYSQLHDIEDCFRVSKHELLLRPAYAWTEDSIKAHVLICFVGLLIFRILRRLSNNEFSSEQIFESIQKYNCNYGGEGYYIFGEMNNVIKTFGQILDLNYEEHYMSKKSIKQLLKY